MAEIYHMVLAETWAAVSQQAEYRPESLQSEGFIHCTVGERHLLEVAERFYHDIPGEWLVLVLDPARVLSEIRWVEQPDGLAYPHIHGPLNLDSVIEVRPFPRDANGRFEPFR
jgi:uncharacterized protein (DUF952 family)